MRPMLNVSSALACDPYLPEASLSSRVGTSAAGPVSTASAYKGTAQDGFSLLVHVPGLMRRGAMGPLLCKACTRVSHASQGFV